MVYIGDVVQVKGCDGYYVIVGRKDNNVGYGNCSYDEDFRLMPLSTLEAEEVYYITNDNEGTTINYRGLNPSEIFTKVEGVAPFEVTKETRYKVRRMKATAKTITVYE